MVSHLVNSVTADVLLYKVHCWRACVVDKENHDLNLVLYYSGMMYNFIHVLGLSQ